MREARPRRPSFFRRPCDAAERCPRPKIEAELEPSDPGVWAAWARERERELTTVVPNQRPGTTGEPHPVAVTPSRLETHAAVCAPGCEPRMPR